MRGGGIGKAHMLFEVSQAQED